MFSSEYKVLDKVRIPGVLMVLIISVIFLNLLLFLILNHIFVLHNN